MKQTFVLFIAVLMTTNFSFGQKSTTSNPSSDYTYYDEDSKEISADKFLKKIEEHKFIIITSDSLKIKKLIANPEKGYLKNKKELINHLENLTSKPIDSTKPIIIIYHPGKDPCNSSGSATQESMTLWHNELEKKTMEIAGVIPIYISKKPNELGVRDQVLTWYEDKNHVIENLFFKYHYPCSSYVIISKKGYYHSQFGEFGKESVWKAMRAMKRK
uniref:hypothetical protein n=1 Tax=Gelidibacter sp. TaxID=2018083 RepID=UPI00404B2E91